MIFFIMRLTALLNVYERIITFARIDCNLRIAVHRPTEKSKKPHLKKEATSVIFTIWDLNGILR
ncbi:MAG: hypothetical protein B6I38_08155 [Anaerolineaceae bacterium 4572_5.1]|nr:MAG: hypothetical protein B6I38_08155 [Anaerolineaceae bacterium 4572_5.1]